MRISDRSEAGAPSTGSLWMKSEAGEARNHSGSASRPSMTGGRSTRRAATLGGLEPLRPALGAAVGRIRKRRTEVYFMPVFQCKKEARGIPGNVTPSPPLQGGTE